MQKKGEQKQLLLLVHHVTYTRFASAPLNHIVYKCHGPAADDVGTHDLDLDLDCLAVAADPSKTGPRVAVRPTAADCSSAQLARPDRNHSAQNCSCSRRSSDQESETANNGGARTTTGTFPPPNTCRTQCLAVGRPPPGDHSTPLHPAELPDKRLH